MSFFYKAVCRTVVFLAVMFLAITAQAANTKSIKNPSIIVNLPSRSIELYTGNTLVKEYPVAIGKPSTPTPTGEFTITYKEVNPWWYPPGKGYVVPSGPDNPLGYRWMSFFGNYGIHGTNAPWSIGEVISNGCIRMHEENAEELFDMVGIGTPVKITYDRVKACINKNGEVFIGIYPDVYGYGDVGIGDVRKKLERLNLNGVISDEQILSMLENENDEMAKVAQVFNVRVNSRLLTERAVLEKDTRYVPVLAIAEVLGIKAGYNADRNTFQVNDKVVPTFMRGKTVYITENDCKLLFNNQVWIEEGQRQEQAKLVVQVNDKVFNMRAEKVENIMAIPVFELARALGVNIRWDAATNTLTYAEQQLVLKAVGNEPFIQLTQVYDIFKAYVYWDIPAGRIELTYPFIPPQTDFI